MRFRKRAPYEENNREKGPKPGDGIGRDLPCGLSGGRNSRPYNRSIRVMLAYWTACWVFRHAPYNRNTKERRQTVKLYMTGSSTWELMTSFSGERWHRKRETVNKALGMPNLLKVKGKALRDISLHHMVFFLWDWFNTNSWLLTPVTWNEDCMLMFMFAGRMLFAQWIFLTPKKEDVAGWNTKGQTLLEGIMVLLCF